MSPGIPHSLFPGVFWNKHSAAAFLSFGPFPDEAFEKPLSYCGLDSQLDCHCHCLLYKMARKEGYGLASDTKNSAVPVLTRSLLPYQDSFLLLQNYIYFNTF